MSETGIATRPISAARQSNSSTPRSERDQQDERPASARPTLPTASSMNVAGRKSVESTSMPGQAGRQRGEGVLDARGHLEGVGARELLDDQEQARAVVDDRVADQRLVVLDDRRDVTERAATGRPAVDRSIGDLGQVGGGGDRLDVLDRRAAGWPCR